MSELVLSLFPGIGLLDRGFEQAGFAVVRGPDLIWGGGNSNEVTMDIIGFVDWVIDELFEGGIDGADCQEVAVRYGLLEQVLVTEPCCDFCYCYDVGASICYRITYRETEEQTAVERLQTILGKFDGKLADGVLLTKKEAETLVKVGIVQWLRSVLETEAPKGM